MNKKVLNINIFMFILFFLMMLTLGIDYLTYFFNANYIISFIISLVFNSVLSYFILKKVKIKTDFSKKDLLFFGVLFCFFIITIPFPDRSFDTFNYHLYLQENPFGNKIGFDFFAGKNLNSFTYAFPDRMFYIFRFFLGYRLGVLLNYLIITTIYYQVKNIIKNIIPKANDFVVVIIAILVSTSLSLIDIVDSYYIDLVSLVLLLEITRLVLSEKINDKNNTILLGYFGLLFGFSFVVKISNAFVLIVLFIIYIIKNRNIIKYINIKNILLAISTLILPFIIYVIYNVVETGNPVFPFYNTIFKSKYFGLWNWLDTRFGPQKLIDKILYPFTMYFHKDLTCDIGIIEPIWSIGYFVSIFYILYYSFKKFINKKEINKDKLSLAITTFFIYLVWINFQLGYTRYGFISLVLGSICTYIFIYDLFKNKRYIIFTLLVFSICYNYYYSFKNYALNKQDWIYNNIFNSGLSTYKYNLKKLFKKGNDYQVKFEEGSVWGIIYNNSGLADMVNPDIPIININDSADGKYSNKLLDKRLSKASHIYTLVDSLDFSNLINRLNTAGYKIVSVKDVFTSNIIKRKNSFTYIFEIKKEEFENNVVSFDSEKDVYPKENSDKISFYIGIDLWTNNTYYKNPVVQIKGIKGEEEIIIDEFEVSKAGLMLDKEYELGEYDSIKITSKDTWLMILNLDGGQYKK